MQFVLVFLAVLIAGHLYSVNARLTFPSEVWIEPGTDLTVTCKTDKGVISRVYTPDEEVPSDEQLRKFRDSYRSYGFGFGRSISTKYSKYTNAQQEDGGIYTCVVFHDDDRFPVEIATSLVHVRDLCAESTCFEQQTCSPDYQTGTFQCKCVFDCYLSEPKLLCTDTCEFFFNECSMWETMCLDGVHRNVAYYDKCQVEERPIVLQSDIPVDITPSWDEEVVLYSGLTRDGIPSASITWYLNGNEIQEFRNEGKMSFVTSTEWGGQIECKIMHCMRESVVFYTRYNIILPPPPGVYHVCSVYPGGVVEQFHGAVSNYDLACSHVLVANSLLNTDYSQGWYVYGTFDVHDGDIALMAMTFFVGTTAFEFQRGWLINIGGEKLEVDEGVGVMLGQSGCEVRFTGLHLRAACPHFYAYYDGVMSGHVRLGGGEEFAEDVADKSDTEFGLCWDSDAGFRTNWRLMFTEECAVEGSVSQCSDAHSYCDKFTREPGSGYGKAAQLAESGALSCGAGSRVSCAELKCEEQEITAVQRCALNQADSVNCYLKQESELRERVGGEECPEEECGWELEIVTRGCPQDNPPFQCNGV